MLYNVCVVLTHRPLSKYYDVITLDEVEKIANSIIEETSEIVGVGQDNLE